MLRDTKPTKILIVDDEEDMRRMLRGVLAPVFEVIAASNGIDALRLLQCEKPRLLLLDMVMPEMGGLEVLSATRRIAPATLVMMLTADADLDSALAALEGGARAYVTKPFEPEVLCREVARMIEPSAKCGDPPWRVRDED
jgi:DNA-binding NtrC family response regulator